MIEETKLLKNWGKLINAQFPHNKAITIKLGNQFFDKFPYSGGSGVRELSNYPLICCDLGPQISSESKSSSTGGRAGRHFLQVCCGLGKNMEVRI